MSGRAASSSARSHTPPMTTRVLEVERRAARKGKRMPEARSRVITVAGERCRQVSLLLVDGFRTEGWAGTCRRHQDCGGVGARAGPLAHDLPPPPKKKKSLYFYEYQTHVT